MFFVELSLGLDLTLCVVLCPFLGFFLNRGKGCVLWTEELI